MGQIANEPDLQTNYRCSCGRLAQALHKRGVYGVYKVSVGVAISEQVIIFYMHLAAACK